jgi:hypothetical protein
MFQIQQITSDPSQTFTLILTDGSSVKFTLYFSPIQYGWFASLTYGTFVLNGFRICNNPNMLNQFKNQIPFGLACFSTANREPSQAQDFSSGSSNLYILSADEVLQYSELLSNG